MLGYRAYETFAFMAGGSGSPEILYWTASSLPAGLTLDAPAEKAATGVASTDILTSAAHGFANGDKVYFQSIIGGTALSALTVYFVRDKTTDTFKLAATLTGAAIDFSTDISAGMIRKCGTGLITGSVSTQGIFVFGLIAVNATGPSTIAYFTLGIESGDGSTSVAGSSDTGMDLNIDVSTREVSLPGATAGVDGPLFLLKEDDTVMLNLRFKKGTVALDPSPTSIKIAFKEFESEAVLFEAGGLATTDWAKSGSGASAYFQVPVTVTSSALAAALSNYEAEAGTKFNAICEIEWKQTITAVGGITELVASTKTFTTTIERDLVV
ncbi:MAG: hypothetical protein D4R65_10060 [Verrucomicrobiaceae bacterium]|nr:MAG: hypothetical protein D4R65_10060 [Verrucomicrobiaceae bacterium]